MSSKTLSYLLKRILLALLTIFLIITITFFVMNAVPGSPLIGEKGTSEAIVAAQKAKYGLDQPLFIQYLNYLKNILKFDFGVSIKQTGLTVSEILLNGFKDTSKIAFSAIAIAIISGIVFGCIAALCRGKWIDKIIMVFSTASVAIPSFVIGIALLIVFTLELKWFPAVGSVKGGLVLPTFALSMYPSAYITRLTRSSMLDVLQQDYIRTAKAKGVSSLSIIFKHGLRNALIPVITYVGPMTAYTLTGSLVIERIFSLGGLGRELVRGVTNRDYPVIMGCTIFLAVLIVFMNLISDILYKVVDPQIDLE